MKLTLLTALLFAAPFTILKAADKISHRLLVTDYGGNRVCIVAASGEIEWEYPATSAPCGTAAPLINHALRSNSAK